MEEKDYPGYSKIAFQQARHRAFSSFRLDLASLSRFATATDDFLVEEAVRRRYEVAEETDTASQSVAELTGSFADTLLSSMIVAFYGRFESFLFDVCRMVYDHELFPKAPEGKLNIKAAKDYLKCVPNLEFRAGTKVWDDIVNLRELRNVIAHSNRILLEGDGKRREAIGNIPYTTINERNEVWLERGILEHMSKTLGSFAASLDQAFGPDGSMSNAESPE